MRAFLAFLVILLGAAAAAVYSSAFIVHQNEQALVLEFGKPKRVVQQPGLHWKLPLVETVDIYPTLAEANKLVAGQWRRNHINGFLLSLLERFQTWRRG